MGHRLNSVTQCQVMLGRMWSKGNTSAMLVGVQTLLHSHFESQHDSFSRRKSIDLFQDQPMFLLGIYPKDSLPTRGILAQPY